MRFQRPASAVELRARRQPRLLTIAGDLSRQDLAGQLRAYGVPAVYLGFDVMMPVIHLYEGTRPYQTVPLQ